MPSACKSAEQFDTRDERLTMRGFTQLHAMEASEGDMDDVRTALLQCGYDHALVMVRITVARPDVQAHAQPYEVFTSTGRMALASLVTLDTLDTAVSRFVDDGEHVDGADCRVALLSGGITLVANDGVRRAMNASCMRQGELSASHAQNALASAIGRILCVVPERSERPSECRIRLG